MRSRILELEGRKGLEYYRALASEIRLRILTLLSRSPMNVNALGQALGLSQSNVTRHVQALERAGLIETEYTPATQGTQKTCRMRYNRFLVALETPAPPLDEVDEVVMPIGMYTLANPTPPCGLSTAERAVGYFDDPQTFLFPERADAQILWMADGFVEYTFPNTLPAAAKVKRLEVSLEACSELPGYDNDYPSDITVWVNDVELPTWTAPGDMGGRRGQLNPSWWPDRDTQYGFLKTWSVDTRGAYLDGSPVPGPALSDINIIPKRAIPVRIGVKPGAPHAGGFNLFGRRFGDHPQDIVLRLHYTSARGSRRPAEQPEATAVRKS